MFSFIRYYKSKPLDDIMLVVQRKMDQSVHGKNKMRQAAVYESSLTFKLNFSVFKGVRSVTNMNRRIRIKSPLPKNSFFAYISYIIIG